MRGLAALTLIMSTVMAAGVSHGDPAYDGSLLEDCLGRVAAEHGTGDPDAEAMRQCIGQAASACMAGEGGDTTIGMVTCLTEEAREWDMILTAWFSRLTRQAAAADVQLQELGSAAPPAGPALQRAHEHWQAFRDASCEYESLRFQGGTAGGPAAASCLLDLTATQALRLMDNARGME